MFDIGLSEILLIAIVALIAIGPEDLPEVLFKLGRLTRQISIFVNGIRNQYSEIMHEAELEHYRKNLMLDTQEKPVIDHAPEQEGEKPHDTTPASNA